MTCRIPLANLWHEHTMFTAYLYLKHGKLDPIIIGLLPNLGLPYIQLDNPRIPIPTPIPHAHMYAYSHIALLQTQTEPAHYVLGIRCIATSLQIVKS